MRMRERRAWERNKSTVGRENSTTGEKGGTIMREIMRERHCFCVCVCVRERERQGVEMGKRDHSLKKKILLG